MSIGRSRALVIGHSLMLVAASLSIIGQDIPDPQGLASKYKEASIRLLKRLDASKQSLNLALSPVSLSITMDMLRTGAGSETRRQIDSILHFAPNESTSSEFLHQCFDMVVRPLDGVKTDLSSTLNYPKLLVPVGSYQRYAEAMFKTAFQPAPMQLIDRAKDGTPIYRFTLVQTLDFQGKWERSFFPSDTVNRPFVTASGQKVDAAFLKQYGEYYYYEDSHLQAVKLPYKTPSFSLWVFLPKEGTSLSELIQGLTVDQLDGWIAKAETRTGTIEIPRVSFSEETEITDDLKSIGLTDAFDQRKADFRKMWVTGALLYKVILKNSITINEKGTEVKEGMRLIGGVLGGGSDTPPPPPFELIANRPFFFAIVDYRTPLPVLYGAIYRPIG